MAAVVVLYNTPTDPDAFDAYYESTHSPLAKQIPGLRSYRVSTGPVVTPDGPAPYHLVAVLSFDSMSELQGALGTPEGQAAVADLGNFATGGVTVLRFEDEDA
jgi:uncharacterized protein (TIGR02118 family)